MRTALDMLYAHTRRIVWPSGPTAVEPKPERNIARMYRELFLPGLYSMRGDPRVDRTIEPELHADNSQNLLISDWNTKRTEVLFTRADLESGFAKTEFRYRVQKFLFKRPPWRLWSNADVARKRARTAPGAIPEIRYITVTVCHMVNGASR